MFVAGIFLLAVCALPLHAQEFGCCSAAFTVDEVVAAARRADAQHRGQWAGFHWAPNGKVLGLGGHSEMTAGDWAVKRFQARAFGSEAFVVLTPIGAAVHHWSHRTKQHTIRILRGTDPLARHPDYPRLIHIDSYSDWHIVAPEVANETQARAAVQLLMNRWNVKFVNATVWNFSIDCCGSLGPPPAWEETSESAAALATGRRWRITIPAPVLQ
jgi:hypothetical protein